MSNWKGYFIKATKTNKIFPLKYIIASSWKSLPKQREEIKAYRDDNTRKLHRVTADGMKTKFGFSTRGNLHEAEVVEILGFFTSAEVDPKQRKIHLEYWDDSSHSYQTGYFYRPNMEFNVKTVTEDDLIYEPLEIECIEY